MIYDERNLVARLGRLSREEKTAFAAACAERLMPVYRLYSRAAGEGDPGALNAVLAKVWTVTEGSTADDLAAVQVQANAMIPDEDAPGWVPERAFGQNGAAAVSYAVDVWLSDDPQDAVWAARQVFDAAEYAGRPKTEGVTFEEAGADDPALSSPLVQRALETIEADLSEIERSGTAELHAFRKRVEREAADWVALFR